MSGFARVNDPLRPLFRPLAFFVALAFPELREASPPGVLM